MAEPIALTEYASGAGCGCKIAPAVLAQILGEKMPSPPFPALLVGHESQDDAAVYDMGNGSALVATTDFFTPMVDDPFAFGQVAAANALSDVYAMGGKPLLALAILGWPTEKLPTEMAAAVLAGGRSVCASAGIPLAGGHSISSPEPIFGLAVNGWVSLPHLKKNNTAQVGDWLLLTKPLGVGILSTAQKRKRLAPEHLDTLVAQLTRLNQVGTALGALPGVHAMTDVTGFGLVGHLTEMASGSACSAQLFYQQIPKIAPALAYLKERLVPDATYRNWNAYSAGVEFEKGVDVMEAFSLLPDPQTNGGLLLAVAPDALPAVQACLRAEGWGAHTEPIGQMVAPSAKTIQVLNR